LEATRALDFDETARGIIREEGGKKRTLAKHTMLSILSELLELEVTPSELEPNPSTVQSVRAVSFLFSFLLDRRPRLRGRATNATAETGILF
jgi:hypothetical protein